MNEYQRLSICKPNYYFIDAPLEILKWGLLLDKLKNEIILQLKFQNQGVARITAIKLKIQCFNEMNEFLGEYVYTYKDMVLDAFEIAGDDIPVILPYSNTRVIKIDLLKIAFENEEIAEISLVDKKYYSDMPAFEEIPILLKDSFLYHNPVGDDFPLQYYPLDTNEYWRCGCGKVNSLTNDECARCGVKKTIVFEHISQTYLSKLQSKNAMKKLKRKKIMLSCIILVLVLSLFSVGLNIFYLNPLEKYESAVNSIQQKDYDYAIKTFTSLNGFKDSQLKKEEALKLKNEALEEKLQNELNNITATLQTNIMEEASELSISKINEIKNMLAPTNKLIEDSKEFNEINAIAKDYKLYIENFDKLGKYLNYIPIIEFFANNINEIGEVFLNTLSSADFRTLDVYKLDQNKAYFESLKSQLDPTAMWADDISLSLSKIIESFHFIVNGSRKKDERYHRGLDMNATGYEEIVTIFEKVVEIQKEINQNNLIPSL